MHPVAKSHGFLPSCWQLCMEEVSELEAGVHVLVCCSAGCGSPAGSDLHVAVVTTAELARSWNSILM